MIGPVVLESLQDYFNRYNTSVDAIVTSLQASFELQIYTTVIPNLIECLVSPPQALQLRSTHCACP